MKEYFSKSKKETKKIAQDFAQQIIKKKNKKAVIISLEGDLGSGKTTFLQGFAKEIGVEDIIKSQSFVIMKKYPILNKKGDIAFKFFYHFDVYRIQNPREILALGFKDIIKDPRNIVAIEWGDKIKKILPPQTIRLKFKYQDKNERKIILINENNLYYNEI